MNITKLFEAQAELDAHITEQHPVKDGEDRLANKVLALQVELGELANEWRGFKFWSSNDKPRITLDCEICRGKGGHYNTYDDAKRKKNKVRRLFAFHHFHWIGIRSRTREVIPGAIR